MKGVSFLEQAPVRVLDAACLYWMQLQLLSGGLVYIVNIVYTHTHTQTVLEAASSS
jgi:hypothetical protein